MIVTKRQLRKIIREAYNSMSPSSKSLANSVKRKFMKLYPDAKVGIDARDGWMTVNGEKAINMSQASGSPLTDEEMIEKMHAVYAGNQVDADIPTAGSRMDTFREGKARITRQQLRKIIREAIDVVNVETGEVIDFGEESISGLPDAAVSDLVKRLGLNMSPGGQLSNADFQKLEDETLGKQGRRADKRKSAQMAADRERLNIDNLLQKLRYWAEDAARDYMTDNPGTDLQDVAYDLADAWEFEFAKDEQEELMWHFDGDLNDLKIYAAESMG